MNETLAALFAGLVAALKKAAPALLNFARFAGGVVFETLRRTAEDNGKLVDQYREILDEERKGAKRPVDGSAERLRNSGYTRKQNKR